MTRPARDIATDLLGGARKAGTQYVSVQCSDLAAVCAALLGVTLDVDGPSDGGNATVGDNDRRDGDNVAATDHDGSSDRVESDTES